MHRRFWLLLWLGCSSVAHHSLAKGQESTPQRRISYTELSQLGKEIALWQTLRENTFLYTEHRERILSSARPLVRASLGFRVLVERVTPHEVFVVVPDAPNIKVTLRHRALPEYGNLKSVAYCGPRSAYIAYLLSKQVGLRIGSEIDLDTAKRLRRQDLLEMVGVVESLDLLLEDFQPRAIAVIANFNVLRVIPKGELQPFYQTRS
jgi:hypothetical protein